LIAFRVSHLFTRRRPHSRRKRRRHHPRSR